MIFNYMMLLIKSYYRRLIVVLIVIESDIYIGKGMKIQNTIYYINI